ncbi:hypothetical protein OG604_49965 [Streptomyces sp. NBC_01231]|nr:hypothetical protein OG604_49965 [Streptomyces sp. NBC_01231]
MIEHGRRFALVPLRLLVGVVRHDRQDGAAEQLHVVGGQFCLADAGGGGGDGVGVAHTAEHQEVGAAGVEGVLGARAEQHAAAGAGLPYLGAGTGHDVVYEPAVLLALPGDGGAHHGREQQQEDVVYGTRITGGRPVAGGGADLGVVDEQPAQDEQAVGGVDSLFHLMVALLGHQRGSR